jgi:hypothetical protein
VRLSIEQAHEAKAGEVQLAVSLVVLLGLSGLIASVLVGALAAALGVAEWGDATLGSMLAVMSVVLYIVLSTLRRGRSYLKGVIESMRFVEENRAEAERIRAEAELERARALPRLPTSTLPTLQDSEKADPPILTSRGGGYIADESGDFLPREDARWLCEQIASRRKWTEDVLGGLTLPYSGVKLSTGERGNYARIMALLVERGIITGRGGPGNKTGVLAVTDPEEMMKRLERRV